MINLTDKVKLKPSVDLFSESTPVLSVSMITQHADGTIKFNGSDGIKTYFDLDADDYDVIWSSRNNR